MDGITNDSILKNIFMTTMQTLPITPWKYGIRSRNILYFIKRFRLNY